MSDGEGSLYDKKGSDEEELNKNRKKRRKEMLARGPVPGEKTKKKNKKGQKPMAGLVLPVPGEKTVAAQAFEKTRLYVNHSKQKVNRESNGNRQLALVKTMTTGEF
jgi:hypothetical protein